MRPRARRLCFAFHGVTTAGAERTLLALVKAAAEAGHDVVVVLPQPGPIQGLIHDQVPGVEVTFRRTQWWMGIDHHSVRGLLKTLQAVVQVIPWTFHLRRLQPSVIFVGSTVTPAPVLAGAACGIPVVTILGESIRTNPTLKAIVPKRWIVRVVQHFSSVTVGVSRYSADQYGGASFIEAPDIGPAPEWSRDRRQEEAGASVRTWHAVMLGTISDEKGQLEAVRAIALLDEEQIPVRLTLYGGADAGDIERLQAEIDRLDVRRLVRYAGTSAEVSEILRSADLSLVCSGNEAYGRVTAESVLVGTPVVAYDRGATGEVLAAGGGVLVDPTPRALAAEIASLVREPARYAALKHGAEARSRSGAGFGRADRTLVRALELVDRAKR